MFHFYFYILWKLFTPTHLPIPHPSFLQETATICLVLVSAIQAILFWAHCATSSGLHLPLWGEGQYFIYQESSSAHSTDIKWLIHLATSIIFCSQQSLTVSWKQWGLQKRPHCLQETKTNGDQGVWEVRDIPMWRMKCKSKDNGWGRRARGRGICKWEVGGVSIHEDTLNYEGGYEIQSSGGLAHSKH